MNRKYAVLVNAPNTNDVTAGAEGIVTIGTEHSDWANYPHLGILTLASDLEDIKGVEPVYLDGVVCPISWILDFITDNSSSILLVGISVLTASYEAGLLIAKDAKRCDPNILTVFGNDHFTALTRNCLINQQDVIDCGFRGNEIVGPFRALVSDLVRYGRSGTNSYGGFAMRDHDEVYCRATDAEPIYNAVNYDLIDR